MRLDTLIPEHFEALFEIHKRAEAFAELVAFDSFSNLMKTREGFVVVRDDGKLAGAITFSDYNPGNDIVIHCFMDPDFHGRWASKKLYKEGFDFPFEYLKVRRISGFCVVGKSDKAGRFLEILGFKKEGTIRQKVKDPADGALYDVNIYGMLKEERRW